MNYPEIERAMQKGVFKTIPGMPSFQNVQKPFCHECLKGKMTSKHGHGSRQRGLKPGDLVHTDVWGPAPVQSKFGKRYFVTFIDDYSGFTGVNFMHQKSEVLEKFIEFDKLVNNRFGYHIGAIQSDNDAVYSSKAFAEYCKSFGIMQQFTPPYSSSSNGVSERKNLTLMNSARALLYSAELPSSKWQEAVSTANYIQNRCPTKSNMHEATPFELWEGVKPDISNFRIFGSKAQVHISKDVPGRHKLKPRSHLCTFVGYPTNSRGYIFEDNSGRYHISNNAQFDEHLFLRKKASRNNGGEVQENTTKDSAEDVAVCSTGQNPAEESSTRFVALGVPFNPQIDSRVQFNGNASTTNPQSDASMERAAFDRNSTIPTEEGHQVDSMESTDRNRKFQHPG
jgi:hypothetical protein